MKNYTLNEIRSHMQSYFIASETSVGGVKIASPFIITNGVLGFDLAAFDADGTYVATYLTTNNFKDDTFNEAKYALLGGSASQNFAVNDLSIAGSLTYTGAFNASYLGINNTIGTNGYGLSLYNGAVAGQPTYGMMFQQTATFGQHGDVTSDWATYLTMNTTANRGWIFKAGTGALGNVASISTGGVFTINKIQSSGEVISTSANTFRMAYGNYGALWRNDGTNTYFLLTAINDQYGSFNTLRPFTVNNLSGYVTNNTGFETNALKTNSITKKTAGSPIVINSGLDASLGLRVHYNVEVNNSVRFTNASWVHQGVIEGVFNQLLYSATSGHIFTGNVGINNSAPLAKLDVVTGANGANTLGDVFDTASFVGVNRAMGQSTFNLVISTNENQAADLGGSIGFGGRYITGATGYATFGAIKGGKENSTSNQYGGYLSFGTRINGSVITERMRIHASGYITTGNATATNMSAGDLRTQGNIDIANYVNGAFRIYDGTTFRGGLGTYQWANGAAPVGMSLYSVTDLYFHTNASGTAKYLINTAGSFSTPVYSSGFAGSGMSISNEGGKYNATFDNLIVRGAFKAYEFQYEKIRVGNGSYWFSDGISGVGISSDSTNYYIWCDKVDATALDAKPNLVPFVVNDIVRLQQFTGNEIVKYEGRVSYVDNTRSVFGISKTGLIGGPITINGDWARIGNTTDANRRGAVYITSSDTNSPYIDVVNGLSAINGDFSTKVRLGKLYGITDVDAGLNGSQTNYYGLYSDNVHLKGHIYSISGNIAGWSLSTANIQKAFTYTTVTIGESIIHGSNYVGFEAKSSNGGITMMSHKTADISYLIGGNSSGEIFRLTTNANESHIANTKFDNKYMWMANKFGVGAGLEISNDTYPRFMVYQDTANYVNTYYYSSSSFGIAGVSGGVAIFQLGSTNQIAGWNFTSTTLSKTNGALTNYMGALPFETYAQGFAVWKDANNYGAMYSNSYEGSFNLIGKKAGLTLFKLSTIGDSSIANFNFNATSLYNSFMLLDGGGLTFKYQSGGTSKKVAFLDYLNNEGAFIQFNAGYGLWIFTEVGQRLTIRSGHQLDIDCVQPMKLTTDSYIWLEPSIGNTIICRNIPTTTGAFTGSMYTYSSGGRKYLCLT